MAIRFPAARAYGSAAPLATVLVAPPPPAILVRPGDMVEAVRAAMMLGATISDLKSEADALASDLDKLTTLRASIASQRDDLARSAQSLALDKTRLTELIRARQQSLSV